MPGYRGLLWCEKNTGTVKRARWTRNIICTIHTNDTAATQDCPRRRFHYKTGNAPERRHDDNDVARLSMPEPIFEDRPRVSGERTSSQPPCRHMQQQPLQRPCPGGTAGGARRPREPRAQPAGTSPARLRNAPEPHRRGSRLGRAQSRTTLRQTVPVRPGSAARSCTWHCRRRRKQSRSRRARPLHRRIVNGTGTRPETHRAVVCRILLLPPP